MAKKKVKTKAKSKTKPQSSGKKGTVAKSGGKKSSTMQRYLDSALGVLEKYGVVSKADTVPELVQLLEEVRDVDEKKVLAIASAVQHMSDFNAMVRDNVENVSMGHRYVEITQLFDSVREDSKALIGQLADGKISYGEKWQNWWMWLRRGTPNDRFERIAALHDDVRADTEDQLKREKAIMDGYIDFRFALKEAEVLAQELVEQHSPILEAATRAFADAQAAATDFTGTDASERSRLQLARDEARRKYEVEDRRYQLLKDVAENLAIGYDVGETLVAKLKQTHDVKDRVHRRSVTFFTTNEHVFTLLNTVYTSQHGLNEATQSLEALKKGANKGLEDVAELGRELERAALEAGYGSTLNPESVQKLVDAITDYQVESLEMIATLRKESEANAREIRRVVENGKQKYQDSLAKHLTATT